MNVVLGLPNEDEITDCDSDDEDCPTGNAAHFGRGILTAPCDPHGLRNDSQETTIAKSNSKLSWKKGPTPSPLLLPEPDLKLSHDAQDEVDCLHDMMDYFCLLYTSPSPRDLSTSRMPSSA